MTPPTAEPVTLAEAKLHLRVDGTDEDTLITMLISSARTHAENVCRRSFMTQTWCLYLDGFPRQGYYGVIAGDASAREYSVRVRGGRIDLPYPQLQSVGYISYIDPEGAYQTLNQALYKADLYSEPGVVTPAAGGYWPETQNVVNAVQIGYTAGYGNAAAVPASIKAWILLRVGALYANREEVIVETRVSSVDLPFVHGLLDPYRIQGYA